MLKNLNFSLKPSRFFSLSRYIGPLQLSQIIKKLEYRQFLDQNQENQRKINDSYLLFSKLNVFIYLFHFFRHIAFYIGC